MRVPVTGANGQVGWELGRREAGYGPEILALHHPTLDITDPAAVEKAVDKSGISLVVNPPAYTAVDHAESEVELAFYVFDGKKKGTVP
nr:NAD-dependent epimerase/dehydratase family protein [Desulfobacterales bacterium]